MRRVILEKTVAGQLLRALKDPKLNPYGILARKLFSMAWRGMPDYMLLCPEGVVVFLELKRPGGKTTELQEREHAAYRKLGHVVYVSSDPLAVLRTINATLGAHK